MDLLDAQATEIRSFLDPAPPAVGSSASATDSAAYSPIRNGPPRPHSAHGDNSALSPQTVSSPPGYHGLGESHSTSSAKRRAADEDAEGSAKQQRSKRNRYIAIACNECKRRKIKCNGQTPCQRCGHLNLQCLYAPNCCSNSFRDSDEFRQVTDQVNHLQQQVNDLVDNMHAFRQEALRLAPIHDRVLPPPSATATPSPSASSIPSLPKPLLPFRVPPSFNGPTSIAFTVDVAKNTLHTMGYSGLGDSVDDGGSHPESMRQMSPTSQPQPTAGSPLQRPPDPLWEFDKNEMIRLCRFHEEEIGVMYPVISINGVIEHAKNLATWMDSARRNGLVPPHGQDDGVSDDKTMMLKTVLCCALAVEEHGNSAKAARLYESIQSIVDKALMSEPADVARLPFFALCAGYRFLSNDEILAWRMMGHVTRLCFELGLHRREGLEKIADPEDRRNALYTFWVAYMLDRRWSFGTGLPFVCHDDKIDPKLPYPENHPYLIAMITYSRLGAKIWKLVDYFEPAVIRELKRSDFEDLDREILEWYDMVPDQIKTGPIDESNMPTPSAPTYDLERLRIWTRLRLNQMRIWLYTPVLHSAISIEENKPLAQTAVDLAKETIRSLAYLNNATNLYRRLQVFYHQFLTSAIAVLFLASTHAPLQFSASCRSEFYLALELVKDMSARSWVSQRLWRTIRSLKAYAPWLGMEEEQRHSGEPMALAHMLAGGIRNRANTSQSPGPGQGPGPYGGAESRAGSRGSALPPSAASPPMAQQAQQQSAEDHRNGLRLQSEMLRIFEGYTSGGIGSRGVSPATSGDMVPGRGALISPGAGFVPMAPVGNVYQHMKDMF